MHQRMKVHRYVNTHWTTRLTFMTDLVEQPELLRNEPIRIDGRGVQAVAGGDHGLDSADHRLRPIAEMPLL